MRLTGTEWKQNRKCKYKTYRFTFVFAPHCAAFLWENFSDLTSQKTVTSSNVSNTIVFLPNRLLCGDVEGKFCALFDRVDTINKKNGPFELVLCVGNFFGVNNREFQLYKSGEKKGCCWRCVFVWSGNCLFTVAVPTYVLGANKSEHNELFPDDGELCPNVFCLGNKNMSRNCVVIHLFCR